MKRAILPVLFLLIPLVSASGGVGLTLESDRDVSMDVEQGTPFVQESEYILELSRAMKVQLATGGPEHRARWTIDDVSVGTSTETRAIKDGAPTLDAGSHTIRIRWSLPDDLAEGDHRLRMWVLEQISPYSGGSGASGSTSGASAYWDLHLTRVDPPSNDPPPSNPPPSNPPPGDPSGDPPGDPPADPPAEPPEDPPDESGPSDDTPSQAPGASEEKPDPAEDRPTPQGSALDEPSMANLRTAGVTLPEEAVVYLVDADEDGVVDRLEDTAGVLRNVHAAQESRQILAQDRGSGAFVVFDTESQEAYPAVFMVGRILEAPAESPSEDAAEPLEAIQVQVPEKTGWIVVSVPDPAPDQAITGYRRGDVELPHDLIWRADGMIHFLDDPDTVYEIEFARPASVGEADGTPVPWSWIGMGAAVVVAFLAGLAVRRRP